MYINGLPHVGQAGAPAAPGGGGGAAAVGARWNFSAPIIGIFNPSNTVDRKPPIG